VGRAPAAGRGAPELTREQLLAHFEGRVARWQRPDDVVFVDALPTGATGKVLKNRLRQLHGGHRWPDA
jgi:3-(methylthio)propionyl---CoA ligase